MMTKNDIKTLQSLKTAKGRKESGLFSVEGNKMVMELLKEDNKNHLFNVKNVLLTAAWIEKNKEIAEKIPNHELISSKQMEQISNFVTPPGIYATATIPSYSIKPEDAENEMILLIDGINDPGNLGTIIRTADWFGMKKIVISKDTCTPWQSKAIQSTMGAIFRIRITEQDLTAFLQKVKTPVYGALMQGENIFKKRFNNSTGIIIIGSESHGIRENILPFVTSPIHIPRNKDSVTESLNVSVAAGIIISEIFRKTGEI